jgi:hypothetical protein
VAKGPHNVIVNVVFGEEYEQLRWHITTMLAP